MAQTFTVAKPEDVAKLLTMLFGKDVSVTARTPSNPFAGGAPVNGIYADQDNTVSALCQFDLALASYAGAALTMIPAGVANEGIKSGQLMDNLADNLREVFNVCVAFFNQGNVPHIRFSQMQAAGAESEPGATLLDSENVARLDLDVDIDGYGSGTMSLRAR